MNCIKITVFALFFSGLTICSFAQEKKEEKKESWTEKGQVYGKVYANFHTNMHTSAFEVSRAYLGYKMKIDDNFSGNVKLDIGVPGETNYDTITLDNQVRFAYFKNAYLQYKYDKLTLQFGLADRHQFKTQEKFWGYRYIYKSFQDQNKFGSSADLGFFAAYKINNMLAIDAAITNGEGYKKLQADDDYIANIGITAHPIKSLTLRVFYDQSTISDDAQSSISGFIGYKHEIFSIGFDYNMQMNHKNNTDKDLSGFSAYATIKATDKIEVFARFDQLASNTLEGDSNPWNESKNGNTLIGGIEYSPVKKVNLSLNYQGFNSDKDGVDNKDAIYFSIQYAF